MKPLSPLKEAVSAEIGQLHKTRALLVSVQFAANHDCEFDVSDALAVIRDRAARPSDRRHMMICKGTL